MPRSSEPIGFIQCCIVLSTLFSVLNGQKGHLEVEYLHYQRLRSDDKLYNPNDRHYFKIDFTGRPEPSPEVFVIYVSNVGVNRNFTFENRKTVNPSFETIIRSDFEMKTFYFGKARSGWTQRKSGEAKYSSHRKNYLLTKQSQEFTVEFHGEARWRFIVTSVCDDNWYGISCNHHCIVDPTVWLHVSGCTSKGQKICSPGWGGWDCNHCGDDVLCENGGTCVLGGEGIGCRCAPQFSGPLCTTKVDECSRRNPCKNGGMCSSINETVQCFCPKPYTGAHCTEVNNCIENRCENAGICISESGIGKFRCKCQPGFSGRLCQYDICECQSSPCLNGGTCTNTFGSFECECTNGFVGRLCEKDINECESNPCLNGAECINRNGSFECNCLGSYYGYLCSYEADACKPSNPCKNGGTCESKNGFASCVCPNNFDGKLCEKKKAASFVDGLPGGQFIYSVGLISTLTALFCLVFGFVLTQIMTSRKYSKRSSKL